MDAYINIFSNKIPIVQLISNRLMDLHHFNIDTPRLIHDLGGESEVNSDKKSAVSLIT